MRLFLGLYEELKKYAAAEVYPMCMPGHKRNVNWQMENPYQIDITEIDGFDNMHEPEGLLLEARKQAADVYKSEETYYLINGSTSGILIGISAAIKTGDRILMARNSHKSVYNAVFLKQLKAEYLYPEQDRETQILLSITPKMVEDGIKKYPDTKLVVITSPTYEGVLSDIKEIANITHSYNIPLLVDAAHGAHLGFHPYFPEHAVTQGADIVIHSIHKTLPAFTQTALLHVNGTLIDRKEIKRYYSIYQSSSPSYLLMAGIEQCVQFLKKEAKHAFSKYVQQLKELERTEEQLNCLSVWNPESSNIMYGKEPSKLVIFCGMIKLKEDGWLSKEELKELGYFAQSVQIEFKEQEQKKLTGAVLYQIFRKKFHIQPEMASKDYILLMTTVCDTLEGFQKLKQALKEIDSHCERIKGEEQSCISNLKQPILKQPIRRFWSYEAADIGQESVCWQEAIGRVTAEYIYLYPPGIPLLVPGEIISEELLEQMKQYKKSGLSLYGMEDKTNQYFSVYKIINL